MLPEKTLVTLQNTFIWCFPSNPLFYFLLPGTVESILNQSPTFLKIYYQLCLYPTIVFLIHWTRSTAVHMSSWKPPNPFISENKQLALLNYEMDLLPSPFSCIFLYTAAEFCNEILMVDRKPEYLSIFGICKWLLHPCFKVQHLVKILSTFFSCHMKQEWKFMSLILL